MSIAPQSNVDLDPDSLIGPVVDSDEKSTIRQGPHVLYSLVAAGYLALISLPRPSRQADPPSRPRSTLSAHLCNLLAEILRQLNPLERSLAEMAGLSALSLAAILVVQTGSLPMSSSLTASSAVAAASSTAPFRAPTIFVSMVYFALLGWYTWDLGLWLLAGPSAGLTLWGLWALLFAHEGIVNRKGRPNVHDQGFKRRAEKKDL
ncbi:hypothetical protein OIV83_002937 [Microbotryomycetes sp. JL201]|nr:hypothetical protein OIV83_002937 [Microbotryomycetes sp. JL201]